MTGRSSSLPARSVIQGGAIALKRPRIVTTYRLDAQIEHGLNSADDVFRDARVRLVNWLRVKCEDVLDIPAAVDSGECYRSDEVPGLKVEIVSIPERGLWAAQIEQPHMPYKGNPPVAGRTWSTDIAISLNDDDSIVRIAAEARAASQAWVEEPLTFSHPNFVWTFAEEFGLTVDRKLGELLKTDNEADFDELIRFVLDKGRKLPVFVISEAIHDDSDGAGGFLLDPASCTRSFAPFAYVAALPEAKRKTWEKRLGKMWAVHDGAVRIFYPGFDPKKDKGSNHRRWSPDEITSFRDGDRLAFRRSVYAAISETMTVRALWPKTAGALFVNDARRTRSEIDRKQQIDSIARRLKTDANNELWEEIKELIRNHEAIVNQLEEEKDREKYRADSEEEERRTLQMENESLVARISHLKKAKQRVNDAVIDPANLSPQHYTDIPDLVEAHFPDRLYLHPRAIGTIKEAEYFDIDLIWQALCLLGACRRNVIEAKNRVERGQISSISQGNSESIAQESGGIWTAQTVLQPITHFSDRLLGSEYWEKKNGNASDNFDVKLRELHLVMEPPISRSGSGLERDVYDIPWPPGSLTKHKLDLHLKKGISREPRYCMRIYFFYDEDKKLVVVGSLTAHLDTRAT